MLLADVLPPSEATDYPVGSPLYTVVDEHVVAVFAVLLLAPVAWLAVRWLSRVSPDRRWAAEILDGHRRLPTTGRFVFWLVLTSATVHLGLVFGHEPSGLTVLYLTGATLLFWASWRMLQGAGWRGYVTLILAGSIVGHAFFAIQGAAPDQLGMATKLVELTALALVLRPTRSGPWRNLGASAATVATVVAVGVAAWIGSFAAVGADAGHHTGEFPEPGTVIPFVPDRPPTAAEQAAADELYAATLAAVRKYQDVGLAAADGYSVAGIAGREFHGPNPRYQSDGLVFDPERPENLVYASTARGPVLVGVLFEVPQIGDPGPTVGGPLTIWHRHENVCFSIVPPALAGLVSPFGVCPIGSLSIPTTNEMIHVWTLPGAPNRFGHLDDEWLAAFLAAYEAGT